MELPLPILVIKVNPLEPISPLKVAFNSRPSKFFKGTLIAFKISVLRVLDIKLISRISFDFTETNSLDSIEDCKKLEVIMVIMLNMTIEIKTSINVNPDSEKLLFFNECI